MEDPEIAARREAARRRLAGGRLVRSHGIWGRTERRRPAQRASKGIPYPAPPAERPGDVAQVGLVGPRHLDGRASAREDPLDRPLGRHNRTELLQLPRDPRRADLRPRPGSSSTTAARSAPPTGLREVVRVCMRQNELLPETRYDDHNARRALPRAQPDRPRIPPRGIEIVERFDHALVGPVLS